MKGVVRHLREEAEVKAITAQQKYDELYARFIEAEDKMTPEDDVMAKISEEHAEYEAVIRRGGGLTISEAEQRIKEILARCQEYGHRYGKQSWEFREQKEELRKIGSLYKTLANRDPRLRQFLSSNPPPRSAPPSVSRAIPSTSTVRNHPAEIYAHERESRSRSTRSNSSRRARGSSRARGRTRGRVNIDNILSGDFSDRWFNFSAGAATPPS